VPEEYAQAAEAVMHAWRVYSVRVTSPQRGMVIIEAMTADPLGGVVVRDPGGGPVPATGPADRPVMALVIGVTEKSRTWIMNLRLVPHWLVMGATRSGKSTLIHAVVTRLAPQNVALIGVDLKGGLELSVYRPRLSGLATTRGEAAEVFAGVLELAMDRMEMCKRADVRAVWELPEPPPPVVVIIDEVAELFLLTDARDREEQALRDKSVTTLVRIVQLGASLDIHVIVGGQRFGSDLGPGATLLRAQLGGRICLHVSDPETAKMALGDVWPEAVYAAQLITADERGTAVTSDGEGSWLRARATLTSVEEASDAAHTYARLTPLLTGITPPFLPDDDQGSAEGGPS
jgi:S-DNA-T family DNA segregation ATPase FtsK/SpoIIIE